MTEVNYDFEKDYLIIKSDDENIINYIKDSPSVIDRILKSNNSSVRHLIDTENKKPLLDYLESELPVLTDMWKLKEALKGVFTIDY